MAGAAFLPASPAGWTELVGHGIFGNDFQGRTLGGRAVIRGTIPSGPSSDIGYLGAGPLPVTG